MEETWGPKSSVTKFLYLKDLWPFHSLFLWVLVLPILAFPCNRHIGLSGSRGVPMSLLGKGPVSCLMLWNFFAFGLSFPVATSNNLASPLLCFSSGVYLLLGTFSSIAPSSTNCLPANPSSCYNFHQISSTTWVTKAILTADWSSLDLHSKGVKVL